MKTIDTLEFFVQYVAVTSTFVVIVAAAKPVGTAVITVADTVVFCSCSDYLTLLVLLLLLW